MKKLNNETIEFLDSWVSEDKSNRRYYCLFDDNRDIYEIKLSWTFICDDLRYRKDLVSSTRLSDMQNLVRSREPTNQDQRHGNPQDIIGRVLPIFLELKMNLMKIRFESANQTVKRYMEVVKKGDALHKFSMVNAINALQSKPLTASNLISLINSGLLNASVADNDFLKAIKDAAVKQLDKDLS